MKNCNGQAIRGSADAEWSFVMVKPRGIVRNIGPAVDSHVNAAGFRVLCVHKCRVDASMMELFCNATPSWQMAERAIVAAHLVGSLVQFHLMTGADALAGSLRIRDDLRALYSEGVFANMVHAPDSPAERDRQASILRSACSAVSSRVSPNSWESRQVALPSSAEHPLAWAEISRIIERLYRNAESVVWRGSAAVTPIKLGEPDDTVLYVEVSRRISSDVIAQVLIKSLPEISPAKAIEISLLMYHEHIFPVAVGPWPLVARLASHFDLKNVGTRVRVRQREKLQRSGQVCAAADSAAGAVPAATAR